VPIGLAIVLFSGSLVPEGPSESKNRHFDLPGAVLVTLGMTALTYGIVTTDRLSWGSPGVLVPLAAGTALLVAFLLHEANLARRPERTPLMPLSVFRLRNLRAANVVIFLLYAAIFGFWFFQSLYMQGTLHYSALHTGIAFVPMTLAVGTAATLAPRIARRIGAAFEACVAAGATTVVIAPYFLGPGNHWDRDIPALAAEASTRHPDVRYLVTAPLGPHPLLMDIVDDRIQCCVGHALGSESACELCEGTRRCRLL
jgi:hypothetical protein